MKHLGWAVCLLGGLVPSMTIAHGPSAARHIDVNVLRTTIRVEAVAMKAALGVGVEDQPAIVGAWLRRGLVVKSDKGFCTITSHSDPLIEKEDIVTRVRWQCLEGSRRIWLKDETLLASEPGMQTFVSIGKRRTRLTGRSNETIISR